MSGRYHESFLGDKVGLALGSGASRGWAHIGVLRELESAGIRPQIVCGSSMGAVVGAAYAAGRLDCFEQWVRALDRRHVVALFDLSLRGGLIKAQRVFDSMAEGLPDLPVASLKNSFVAVATDLGTGREVWLREGSLHQVLRASAALPGLIRPVRIDDRWLIDGGLVNPVPVSVCRALGAETVIAVDLNTTLVRRVPRRGPKKETPVGRALASEGAQEAAREEEPLPTVASLQAAVRELAADLRQRLGRDETHEREHDPPSIFEVVMGAIGVMQVHITRSRMAGDPPDLLVTPRLSDFAMLDFDRAGEAIAEGRRAARLALTGGLLPDALADASEKDDPSGDDDA